MINGRSSWRVFVCLFIFVAAISAISAMRPAAADAANATETEVRCEEGRAERQRFQCETTVTNLGRLELPPRGTVNFRDNGNRGVFDPSPCTLEVLNRERSISGCGFTYSAVTLGSRQIEAAFQPREEDRLVFEPSSGTAPVSFRAISTATLRCAPSPVVIGATTSCEVVITHLAGTDESAHVPSGQVTFAVLGGRGSFASNSRCDLVPRDAFSSSCRIDFTPEDTIDTRTVVTLYQGDDFNEGTLFLREGTAEVEVLRAFRSTAVTVSCQPERVGLAEPSRCLAQVADNNEGATSVSGSIVFERNAGDGGGDFSDDGTCVLVREDPETATCELDYTPTVRGGGTHGIVARYSGDGGHVENSGTGQVLVKTPEEEEEDAKDPTTTTVKCQPSTLAVGRTSLCIATVEGTGANPSPLTGSVEFIDDGQGDLPEASCQVEPGDGAKAGCSVPYAPAAVGSGEHRITAAYSGDGGYRKSRGEATLKVGTIRFAAPGGTGADPCADRATPCSLFTAADLQAPGTTIGFGDEVVLLPGTYDNAAGDLGPNRALSLPGGASLHGEEGRARPVIKLSVNTVAGRPGFFLRSEDIVSRIEIDSTAVPNALDVAGVVDGVIVRSSAAAAVACINNQGAIRNSACLASGPDSAAIAANSGGGGPSTVRLRNVTALSTGAGSIGLRYIARAGSDLTVDAKSVLTRGVATDVVARGLSDPPNTPGTGGKVAIDLDHSDYVNVATATDAGGGIATVTPAGFGTNIVAEPKLAADQVHQLADSLTINAGATDEFTGGADIDGEQRVGDGIADIGADEFAISPTETTLTCVPDRVEIDDAARCTATVTGTSVPTGEVEFATDDPGEFAPERCTLDQAGTCAVDYTPDEATPARHRLTATYKDTPEHALSAGSFDLNVTAEGGGGDDRKNATTTTVDCRLTTVILGGGSVCTAVVEDTGAADRSVPTGTVEFGSARVHGIANVCTLFPTGPATARCQTIYDPEEVGDHEVLVDYAGDADHEISGDTAELTVNDRNGGHETETTLDCRPADVIEGGASVCTVEVEDVDPAAADTPGGLVVFASDGAGAFSTGGCTLFSAGEGKARCQLIYTPAAPGDQRITALYAGEDGHEPSRDSTQLTIIAPTGGHDTTTALRCQPAGVRLGATTTCTATVTDIDAPPNAPARAVIFASDGPGSFNLGGCTLNGAGAQATCQIAYRPSELGTGTHTLTAIYEGALPIAPGAPAHEPSRGQVEVTVAPALDPPPPPPGRPGGLGTTPPVITPPAPGPVAPNTILRKKPRKKTAKRKAKFKFVADQAGSSFQCKLDKKPFKPCRSPWKKKVKAGRHTFRVRAINAQGMVDPSPAVFKWKVGKASRPKR